VSENLAAAATFGHWVSMGNSTGPVTSLSVGALSEKSLTFTRPVLFHYTGDPQRLASMADRL